MWPRFFHIVIILTKTTAKVYLMFTRYVTRYEVMEFTNERIRSEPPSWLITPFKELCYGQSKES